MKELIITHLPNCPGLQRCARNDVYVVNDRYCKGAGRPRQSIQESVIVNYRACTSKYRRMQGFSLIELLISLIIISLIISLFVPILTGKLKHREIALASKGVSLDCAKFDNKGRCLMCSKDGGCSLCSTQLEALDGKYVYPPQGCDYKDCTDGCKVCDKDRCIECKENYEIGADKKTCVKSWIYPSVENCARVDSIYIPAKYNGGLDVCVTKKNFGDLNTLQIPNTAGVTTVNAISGTCSGKCCYTGQTARYACDNIADSDYSGCNRTGCNWEAAQAICANFHFGNGITKDDWRLPKYVELSAWANNITQVSKGKGTAGLQFCNHYSGYGSPRCHYLTGDCKTTSESCRLHHVWGQSLSDTRAYFIYLESNKYLVGTHTYNQTASGVRCVLERYSK